MNRSPTLLLALVLAYAPAGAADPKSAGHWPQWRGPLGTGVAPSADPPIHWSESRNLRWKTAIPGKGHSTPVIWGDRLFLTTAIPFGSSVEESHEHSHGAHNNVAAGRGLRFVVMAIDRRDGKILWQTEVSRGLPHETAHESGSWASQSPVTDGEIVVASFGSGGVYGLSHDGELLWKTRPGRMRIKHGHGEGSSPALHGKTVVVNWDHEDESFLLALDSRSGKRRWRRARDESTSWSTPLIVEHEGRTQVIVSATSRVRSYDLATGKTLWECGGLSGNVVASPVAEDGVVYVGSSYEKRSMIAIRLDAKGDVTGSDAVVWKRERDTPYVPSPLLYDGMLLFLKHYQGILTNVDAPSGRAHFGPERIPGIRNVYASPVGAAGRIYITDLGGATTVLRRSAKLETLARNRLPDSFSASAAIAGDRLYLRGESFLYCIARDEPDVADAP